MLDGVGTVEPVAAVSGGGFDQVQFTREEAVDAVIDGAEAQLGRELTASEESQSRQFAEEQIRAAAEAEINEQMIQILIDMLFNDFLKQVNDGDTGFGGQASLLGNDDSSA